MIIKETQYETCEHCGARRRVADDVRGCDVCKRVFSAEDGAPLNFTVHYKDDRSRQVDCCSWSCVLKALRQVDSDYFVSLPFLHFDANDTPEGARAADFFNAIGMSTNG